MAFPLRASFEMHDLFSGMNAGISSASANNTHPVIGNE
jgi:hypothetical protein